ncbi:MAG TPA: hypothetical protein VFL57_20355 [Bryobacteraceae bacterium]|nr:hypothetical protein [Bryobacteraceae bacterium]
MSARSWLTLLLVVLMSAASASAQRGGFGGGFRGGGGFAGRGFGGHGFAGHRFGGHGFGRGGFISGPRGFAGGIGFGHGIRGRGAFRVGGFHGGFGGWYWRRPWTTGAWWPAAWWPSVYAPAYTYGAPYGYGYGYGYGWAPSAAPVVTVVEIPPMTVAPPATIVINETPRPAPAREDRREAPAEAARTSTSPVYLIAAKSGTIWAARAYWVEGGSLHFVTMHDERRTIALDEVDRVFSEQLNRERRVDFRLE